MNTVTWTPDMRLGLPSIDAAHESFLCKMAELDEISDERFCAGFQALIAHVERDFHEEEEQMEGIDYPGLCSHREQHARVLGALHQVAGRVMDGEIELGREALCLLPQWFIMHLSTMDTAFALAMELHQSKRLPELHAPPAQ